MTPQKAITARANGFFLLEIIVSIALFALVGTAMVAALHHLAKSSNVARHEVAVCRRFDSILAEVTFASGNRVTSGTTTFPADGSGVTVTVEVSPEKVIDIEGASLDSIYRIKMTGKLQSDPHFERTTERLVFFKPHGRIAK
jgi:hypothetical protein